MMQKGKTADLQNYKDFEKQVKDKGPWFWHITSDKEEYVLHTVFHKTKHLHLVT